MASGEVFVDTSALYAFVDKRDSSHQAACRTVLDLVRGRRPLLITDYVVMRELKIREALTTDHHFAEAGFHPLLPF